LKNKFVLDVDENKGIIFKVCRMYCKGKEDIEDLFQEILLQAWNSYSSFKGESKFSTWLYRIAINTAITRLRKEKRQTKFNEIDSEALQVKSETTFEKDEKIDLIYNAINHLSEIERAITMLYLDEYSYKEISEIVGISESNVGFKLNKIKTKLKNITKSL
jgi:RNA polymerase sigma-70 factor (ECF subfamily)